MRIVVHLLCVYCLIIGFGCKSRFSSKQFSTEKLKVEEKHDSIKTYPNWIMEFKRLRAALYQNNIDSLCTFFDFPLTKEQSEGLVAAVNFRASTVTGESIRIITKQDFIDYSWQIFPTDYVKGLLPIKSDSLLKNNFNASPKWELPKENEEYFTFVSYDESEESISLSFNVNYFTGEKGDNGTLDMYESAAVFIFKMDKNHRLKFDQMIMAG
jgi:hypothetical protein